MKLILWGAFVILGATLPIFSDPMYHQTQIPFFLWVAREIEEAYTGERHKGDGREESDPLDRTT